MTCCGSSLAQAPHERTLILLHPAHTSQACAHPDLVCPAQLGPHITRFKERTDVLSGKRAYSDLASGDWMRDTEVRRHGQACMAQPPARWPASWHSLTP